jgi:hypothetical protein
MIPHYCPACLTVLKETDITPEGQSYCPHCHNQAWPIDRLSTSQILDILEELTETIRQGSCIQCVRTDIDTYPIH